MDLEHVEAVVEVLAKLPLLERGLEVAVGGGDDAHVGLQSAGTADALELALLEDAQELRLQERAHLGDLVEEERAAGGLLDATDLARDRAGERALLVAEQLRLEELLGQRGAVDRHQRLGPRAATPGE